MHTLFPSQNDLPEWVTSNLWGGLLTVAAPLLKQASHIADCNSRWVGDVVSEVVRTVGCKFIRSFSWLKLHPLQVGTGLLLLHRDKEILCTSVLCLPAHEGVCPFF